jgi:hypothetical protein
VRDAKSDSIALAGQWQSCLKQLKSSLFEATLIQPRWEGAGGVWEHELRAQLQTHDSLLGVAPARVWKEI